MRKHGGFIPGVRPGAATVAYIKRALSHITLPGAIFLAAIAVAPSVVLTFTDNALIRSFGGTSILIMVGVALDTMSKIESLREASSYEASVPYLSPTLSSQNGLNRSGIMRMLTKMTKKTPGNLCGC